MAIPTEKAYEILGLPLGASKDAIEQSYKKLALKWHPEKYTTSKKTQDALKKFKMINLAYRKLIHNNERNERDITLHEMFEQYRQVFHSDRKNKLPNNCQTFQEVMKSSSSGGDGNQHHHQQKSSNTTLLELNANNNYSTVKTTTASSSSSSSSSKKQMSIGVSNENSFEYNENNENVRQQQQQQQQMEQQMNDPMANKQKIKTLAIKGNELAKQSEFVKAIEKFTEAIRYDCSDKRLFSNRSYCYDKINCFQEALMDAERAIALEPTWPKGYFRKGRALYGLKMYKEAEEAYEKVLEIDDINDPELEEELFKTRSLQLQEMGFSKAQSEIAIRNNVTVQAALEAILMYSDADKSNESCSDMDNNELDYNENDSENGEDNLSALLNRKLQSTNLSKQLLKQQAAASIASAKGVGTRSPSSSPSGDSSSTSSSMLTLQQQSSTTTTTSAAPTPQTYLTTLLSRPAVINTPPPHSPRNSNSRPSKSQSPPTTSHNYTNTTTNNNISNTSSNSSSSNSNGTPTTSLWVGNVDSSVTDEMLIELFSAYGNLTNVRCLPDKYCAFINYKTKDEASRAMTALQGKYLEGQRLLIKYPDNPNTYVISNIIKSGNKLVIDKKFEHKPVVLSNKKTPSSSPLSKQQQQAAIQQQYQQQQMDQDNKPSGPVNGNECYFWRTTGCLYADKCRYEHIKKNKGIDKKPWHK